MNLNIGIDIDGCLNNHHENFYNYILKNYNLKIDLTKYNNTKFLLDELGLENLNEIYDNFAEEDNKPEFLSSFFINKLIKKHNIFIITARSYNSANKTEKWLNKYNFNYNDIFFECGNKVDTCKYQNIDYMIDDSPYNIYNLIKNNINTIVFSRPYNKQFYNGDKVYIAKNWIDIYNYLKNKE